MRRRPRSTDCGREGWRTRSLIRRCSCIEVWRHAVYMILQCCQRAFRNSFFSPLPSRPTPSVIPPLFQPPATNHGLSWFGRVQLIDEEGLRARVRHSYAQCVSHFRHFCEVRPVIPCTNLGMINSSCRSIAGYVPFRQFFMAIGIIG